MGYTSDIAFSPRVKEIQTRKGSREMWQKLEETRAWKTEVDAPTREFIEAQRSFFIATASAEGTPYIQHRGGPPGFLKVLDPGTLGFADYAGNRQYISQGNLVDNPRVHLFLIDFMTRQRIKIWGEAKVVEDDADLIGRLMPEGYKARPEQAFVIDIVAWDVNCPQHIPQRFEAEDVARSLAARDEKIAALEAEIAALKAG